MAYEYFLITKKFDFRYNFIILNNYMCSIKFLIAEILYTKTPLLQGAFLSNVHYAPLFNRDTGIFTACYGFKRILNAFVTRTDINTSVIIN